MSNTFFVEFDSNLNLEELYAKNQEIILKEFVCALGNDKNFEFGHRMRYVFQGDLELRGTSKFREKQTYHYVSRGGFYENPHESSGVYLLAGSALTNVLGGKNRSHVKLS